MLKLKKGVSLLGAATQTILGITSAAFIYHSYGENCTVTSVVDGKHGRHSHHYKGCAWDLRTRNLSPDVAMSIARELQEALGDEFQVVLEKDHIHCEFDPK